MHHNTPKPYTPPTRLSAITLPAFTAAAVSRALTSEGTWHGVDPESDGLATVFFKAEVAAHVVNVLQALPTTATFPFWGAPVASMAIGVVNELTHQIDQMKGLFGDEDGTIAQALDDAQEIIEVLELVKGHCSPQDAQDLPTAAIQLLGNLTEAGYALQAADQANLSLLVEAGYAGLDVTGLCTLTDVGRTAAALAKISHPDLFDATAATSV